MLRIGISACFFPADPKRAIFKGKPLQYLEQSLAHWVLSEGVLAYMIPAVAPQSPIRLLDLVLDLDGLVLQGGSDVCPKSYGEEPLKPEWNGDHARDLYEIELVREFMAQDKPVLGVCRGAQLINVALGGTLYQDISTQIEKPLDHRNWEIYDQNSHSITFEEGSRLKKLYPGLKSAKVNSVHHQAIKKLGKGLLVEARSPGDSVIEAVRVEGEPYVYAVQWHPEFTDTKDKTFLDSRPILTDFVQAAKTRRALA